MADVKFNGHYLYEVTPWLRGIANRQVRDYGYKSIRTFLNGAVPATLRAAENLTKEKYPEAMSRDSKRRPAYIRGRPHLQNSWKMDKSGNVGEHPVLRLKNTRPKAGMLIHGFGSASVIRPTNFFYSFMGQKPIPVLVYPPGADQRSAVSFKTAIKNPHTVIRPVPSSQKHVPNSESIPFKAFEFGFEGAADRRFRKIR